jgi:cytochrome b
MTQRTLIWDWPTRLFHWPLAICFALAWLSAGSDVWLPLHVFCGYLMLGLLGFRLIWGVLGSYHSRFANFWFGPAQALAYLRQLASRRATRHVGHNPAGSLAIYALLTLTLVVCALGILTLGGEEQRGLAAGWLTLSQGKVVKEVHEAAGTLMLMLVGLHVSGVVFESILHHENLARAMLDGHKQAALDNPKTRPHGLLAIGMMLGLIAFAGWWFSATDSVSGSMAAAPPLPENALWREECGSCHTAFYPSLLPARSWQHMMATQDQHFGTDLGLSPETARVVRNFLMTHAADRHLTEAGYKTDRSLSADALPLRITDTPYWRKKHRDITATDWSKPQVKSQNNCVACHSDADAGTFDDGAMRIP